MLLTREEMTFDFGGQKLDPVRDKALIEWMLNQVLYGEVTGIQVGHWLYDAPDLEAAKFLARQSLEEMQHVDNFLRIMTMLGCSPKPAHPAVRFLATGMMGGSWAEHVTSRDGAGQGFVLQAFYAVIDTLDHKPSADILRRAVKQEERHVEFGEDQTKKAIEHKPWLRRASWTLARLDVGRAAGSRATWRKRLPQTGEGASVLRHLPEVPRSRERVHGDPVAPDRPPRQALAEMSGAALRRRGSVRRQAARRTRWVARDAVPIAAVVPAQARDRHVPARSARDWLSAAERRGTYGAAAAGG